MLLLSTSASLFGCSLLTAPDDVVPGNAAFGGMGGEISRGSGGEPATSSGGRSSTEGDGGAASGGQESGAGGEIEGSGGASPADGGSPAAGGSPAVGGSGPGCEAGECGPSCSMSVCGAACVEVESSEEHCGACDNACALGTECIEGVCDPVISGSASSRHTCIVRKSGALLCLGVGDRGVLGRGRPGPRYSAESEFAPVVTGPGPGSEPFLVTQVAASTNKSCATDLSGKLFCWGMGANGRNGDGGTSDRSAPVAVVSDDLEFASRSFEKVSVSSSSTCALDDQGDVWCFGRGGYGSGSAADRTKAARVTLPLSATDLELADQGTACAILTDESVHCWGQNLMGLLGQGSASPASNSTPALVDLPPAKNLVAGASTMCILSTSDTLVCWGWNANSLLDSSTTAPVLVPLELASAVDEAWLLESSLCYRTSGETWCRGSTETASVGAAPEPGSLTSPPVHAAALDDVEVLFDGGNVTCGHEQSEFVCFGEMPFGGFPGSAGTVRTPTFVVDQTLSVATDLLELSLGPYGGCSTFFGGMRCWGHLGLTGQIDRHHSARPLLVTGLLSPADVSLGYDLGLVIDDQRATGGERQAYTWLQTGGVIPLALSGEETDVDAGRLLSCVVQGSGPVDAGPVYCWGSNNAGQLGFDTAGAARTTPTSAVGGVTDAVQVAAGSDHACALLSTGEVACWGSGAFGQLGQGSYSSSTSAVLVTGINSAVEVASGHRFSCALLNTGAVQCWGDGGAGKLGDGAAATTNLPSTLVSTGKAAVSIDLGYYHGCAAYDDGSVYCWGDNLMGQVDGARSDVSFNSPQPILGVSGATKVIVNTDQGYASCALSDDGTAKCWGQNGYSALGTGSVIHAHLPTAIPLP